MFIFSASLRQDYYRPYDEIVAFRAAPPVAPTADLPDAEGAFEDNVETVFSRLQPAAESAAPTANLPDGVSLEESTYLQEGAFEDNSGSDTHSESDFTDLIYKATSKSPLQVIVNIMSNAYKAGCNVLNRNEGDIQNSLDHLAIGNTALSRLQKGPRNVNLPSNEVSAINTIQSTSQRRHFQEKSKLQVKTAHVKTKQNKLQVINLKQIASPPTQGVIVAPVSTTPVSSSSALMLTPPRTR